MRKTTYWSLLPRRKVIILTDTVSFLKPGFKNEKERKRKDEIKRKRNKVKLELESKKLIIFSPARTSAAPHTAAFTADGVKLHRIQHKASGDILQSKRLKRKISITFTFINITDHDFIYTLKINLLMNKKCRSVLISSVSSTCTLIKCKCIFNILY